MKAAINHSRLDSQTLEKTDLIRDSTPRFVIEHLGMVILTTSRGIDHPSMPDESKVHNDLHESSHPNPKDGDPIIVLPIADDHGQSCQGFSSSRKEDTNDGGLTDKAVETIEAQIQLEIDPPQDGSKSLVAPDNVADGKDVTPAITSSTSTKENTFTPRVTNDECNLRHSTVTVDSIKSGVLHNPATDKDTATMETDHDRDIMWHEKKEVPTMPKTMQMPQNSTREKSQVGSESSGLGKPCPYQDTKVPKATQNTQYTDPQAQISSSQWPSRPPRQHHSCTPYIERDSAQVVRLQAQLIKAQTELSAERSQNTNLRTLIRTEEQHKIELALTGMMTALLSSQAEALNKLAAADTTSRALAHREQKIKQVEIFLAEGQKQFYHELERRGIRHATVVELELARREAMLAVHKDMADAKGQLALETERLHLRDAALTMREQQYKALVRSSLESEIRLVGISPAKASELAEMEYNNGYVAGKSAGIQFQAKKDCEKAFWQGFEKCQRMHRVLADLKMGRIGVESEDVGFLWDAGGEWNLYNVGRRVGESRGEGEGSRRNGVEVVGGKGSVMKGVEHPELTTQSKTDSSRGPDNSDEDTDSSNHRVNKTNTLAIQQEILGNQTKQYPALKYKPQQHSSSRMQQYSSRPSFASEFRPTKPVMHNGHYVLANCPLTQNTPPISDRPGVNGTGDEVEVEGEGEEREAVIRGDDLIDLSD